MDIKIPSMVVLQFTRYKLPVKSPWQEDSARGLGIGKEICVLFVDLLMPRHDGQEKNGFAGSKMLANYKT